jgi:hypothetical protein
MMSPLVNGAWNPVVLTGPATGGMHGTETNLLRTNAPLGYYDCVVFAAGSYHVFAKFTSVATTNSVLRARNLADATEVYYSAAPSHTATPQAVVGQDLTIETRFTFSDAANVRTYCFDLWMPSSWTTGPTGKGGSRYTTYRNVAPYPEVYMYLSVYRPSV